MERAPDLLPNHLQPLSMEENEKRNMFSHIIEELGLQEHTQHKLAPSDVLNINQNVLSNASCRSKKDIAWRFLRQLMSLNPNFRDSVFCSIKTNLCSLLFITGQGTSPIDISMYLSEANEGYNLPELVLRDGENELTTVHPLDVLCALLNCSNSFLQQDIITRLSMCQFSVPLLLPASDGTNYTFMLWAMRAIMNYLPSPTETGEVVEENLVNIPMPIFSFVRLGECKNMSKSKILNQVLSLASHSCRKDFVHRQMSCGKGSRIISNGLVEMTWYFPTKNSGSCCALQPFAIANLRGDMRTNQIQFKFLANVSSAVFILLEEIDDCKELSNEECDKFYFIVGHDRNDKTKQLLTSLFLSFGIRGVQMGDEENLEEKILDIIKNTTKENPKLITLTDMTALVSANGFSTDEDQMDCQYAKLHTTEMTHDILTTIQHNGKYLRSLKELRVLITKDAKETNQLIQQGKSNMEQVQHKLHKSLLTYLWSDVITDLVYAFTFMSQAQKQYFLKLMCHRHKPSTNAFEEMQRNILYDLVHIYQAEAIVMKAPEYIPRCSKLPSTAADLLLDGFPMILISEDSFSIPLQWINDVLTDLVNKSRGPCQVRVISALGVYSTGKSSLLYTMFGFQFQVTRPQPTRGALMSLIKLDDSFKQVLDCDFLLVIDTEGLRAPKSNSAKERYEHDNALAAFIIGISDIVIFSLPSVNPSDTINTLQIAVCALLKMSNLRRKPTLYFAQTNVTNASSDGENSKKDKIYECLNDTFGLAAKAIKRASFLSLNDVLKCDFLSSHWYNFIPALWQKDPFNGGINSQYAEKVMKLKQHLIHALESNQGSSRTMQDFIDDIKRMWNSVNLEPILKFEDIKEFISYTELSDLFREVERSMHKELSHWMSKNEAQISLSYGIDILKKDMLEQLQKIKEEKSQNFKPYLDSDRKQFEEEFTKKFDLLSKELEAFYNDKCAEMHILSHGMEMAVVEDFCSQEWDPDELEPNFDFNLYWKDKVGQLEFKILKKLDIQDEFIQILKKEMRDRGSLVTEVLNSVENLSNYTSEILTINEKHIDVSWFIRKGARDNNNHTKSWSRLDSLVQLVTKKCSRYVQTLVKLNKDYEPVHCFDLLRMINKVIKKEEFPFTDLFEVDLKLHILRRAATAFQETHNAHVKAKEEKLFLQKQKLPPLNTLKSIIQDKRSAKRFCRLCLKPAMELHVTSTLQPYVIRDVVRTVGAVRKSRRTSQMLYVIKGCNLINIYNHCSSDCHLQANAISSTIAIFKRILQRHRDLEYNNIDVLTMEFRSALANELSLLQGDIGECHLQVTSSTPQQFSSHVDFFIRQLKNELTPNAETIRILFLRVCERLFGCKTQNQHCSAPYNARFRSHQRNTRSFYKTSKHSKIKTVEPHPCAKKASTQKGRDNMCNKLPPLQSSNHVWHRRNEDRGYFWKVKPAVIQLTQPGIPLAATSGKLTFSWLDIHRQI